MSLQVWLPLNGNLNNQGLSNITVAASGAVVSTSGKIGSCYSFDGSDDYISLTGEGINKCFTGKGQEFSIAFWVYRADATRGIIFGDYQLTGAINFNLELDTAHRFRFYWTANPDKTFTTPITASAWSHVAFTYDGAAIKYYLNGILKETYAVVLSEKTKTNSSPWYLGRDSRTGTTALNGRLNDFRLYDHCLSVKEVKEISKGLVLHYKLTGNGQENLLKNSNFDSRYTSGTTSQHTSLLANDWGGYNSGVANPTTVYHAHLSQHDGQYVYRYVKNSSNSWLGISQQIKDRTTVGTTYTFSCELYRVSGTNYPHGGHYTKANSSASNSFQTNYAFTDFQKAPVGQWIRYSATITVPASCYINDGVNFYIYGHSGGSGEFLMRHPKLEVGSKATPWIPNSSDAIYTSLGFNTAAVQDSSGYSYDGTTSSTFTYTSDCIRYNTTANFASDKKIYTPVLPTSGLANSYTITWWAKTSVISGKMFWGFSDGNRLNLYGGIYCNTGDSSSNPFVGVSAPSLNVWHHYAMVGNGSTVGLYVDGVLKGNATTYKSITGTRIYLNGWSSATDYDFNGLMNDFRIYATALSAADIKELYQIPIAIDKSGNAFASEFIEGQKPEFEKTGIMENSYIHENEADDSDSLTTFHIGKTKTFANQFYEV